ncbi:MAG: LysR family transcriptional regulator [Actinomycetota bacterium]|nr:LysR family transcriptional regulator [Actinomycetota bacterium]
MDVRHLTLLRELRERGSVAAVAAATFRTPSAVSQQLRTAQRDAGIALVEPDGRGVRLTEAGQLLAHGAMEVETALARVQARLEEFSGEPSGIVRVASLPSAAEYLVPPVLVALLHTRIELKCTDVDVAEPDFSRLANDYDLVIGHSLIGEIPSGAEGLNRTVLGREPLDIALSADHVLAGKESVAPEDVIGEPWISVPPGYPFEAVVADIEARTGQRARVVQHIRDNRVVEALVAAGLGIALLPRFTTRERPDLVLRPLTGVQAARWVVGLSRPDRAERAAVRRVVAELLTVGEGKIG